MSGYDIHTVADGFEIKSADFGQSLGTYKTERQAKRRVRDLLKADATIVRDLVKAQTAATGSAKKPKGMAAKASSPVKKSAPVKPAEKPEAKPTKAPAAKPAEPAATKPGSDIKPARCKAVPASIDGKPVSNYRQVRLAIEAAGPDAGFAHGLHLGLPHSQVKAYVKELVVLIEKAKNKPPKGNSAKAPKPVSEFEPHFRFDSHDAATKAALSQARRCGLAEAHFHILTENEKFAIAPIHFRTQGQPPVFERGDIVMDTIIADSRAIIQEAGPQQCVVKYDDPKRGEQIIPNVYLYKIGDKAAPKEKTAKPAKGPINHEFPPPKGKKD